MGIIVLTIKFALITTVLAIASTTVAMLDHFEATPLATGWTVAFGALISLLISKA